MNAQEQERTAQLLRSALRPVDKNTAPAHDLWPRVQARLAAATPHLPWYEWALAGALATLALCFPGALPLLLYYL
jgi:hypothetical protein